MKGKATIKDVAEYAGVSIGTVDRVLHNRGRYSKASAVSVHNAIRKLNYTPSQVASALVSMKKNFTIGVNYPLDNGDINERFWVDAKKGVEKAADELAPLGISVITYSCESFSDALRLKTIQEMVDNQVDAIVTSPFFYSQNDNLLNVIPKDIPSASVINRNWNDNFLFHIGPDDEAMGVLIAKCIRLYCGEEARVTILAPNYELESTHKRIQGFVSKLSNEYPKMEIVRVLPIISNNFPEANKRIEEETEKILSTASDLSAVYITNGFIKPIADVIRRQGSSIKLFGHEYVTGIKQYLEDGSITATVCQEPFKQWYQAVMSMANYLLSGTKPTHIINADCSLLIRETVPLLSEYFSQSI